VAGEIGLEEEEEDTDVEEDTLTVTTGTGYTMPEGQMYAGAVRVRWDPDRQGFWLDGLEGLAVAYQRGEELIPVGGATIEIDSERTDTRTMLELYAMVRRGAAGNLRMSIGRWSFVAGGGTTLTGGYGFHVGVAYRGRVTVFGVGSYESGAPLSLTAGEETVGTRDVGTGMLGTMIDISPDHPDDITTTLFGGASFIVQRGVAASVLATEEEEEETIADEEGVAFQVDLQAGVRRESPTRRLDIALGFTHWQGAGDELENRMTFRLSAESRTSWFRGWLQNPRLGVEYTHELGREDGEATLMVTIGGATW
jgi:hypothetical protein